MKREIIIILAIIFVWLIPVNILGQPSISTTSGNVQQSGIIMVNGTNFGEKHTPDHYDYFDDYTIDWSCDTADGSCSNPPASSGISWAKLIFGFQSPCSGDCLHTQIDGNPLFNINQQATYYSTGRSFVEWPEYDAGPSGRPNGSLRDDFTDYDEIFILYNILYDPAWPIEGTNPDYRPPDDKQFEVFLSSSGRKIFGNWIFNGGHFGYDPLYATNYQIFGDESIGPTCPSCADNGMTSQSYPYRTETPGLDEVHWDARGKWHEVKIYMKLNTWTGGSPNEDGVVKGWVDGIKIIDDESVILSSTVGDKFDYVNLIGNWSGGTDEVNFQPGEEFYVSIDDVFINFSETDPTGGIFPGVACVYISNNATWGIGPVDKLNGDSNFIRQKVGGSDPADYGFKSWNNSQLKIEVNLGSLDIYEPVYLYVTNWAGETNSDGYRLVQGLPPERTTVEIKSIGPE
ncbi:hypothetical protein ACFL7M_07035 [Thermodesulfobacteriota bacterium]